jgi:hypothetical protein
MVFISVARAGGAVGVWVHGGNLQQVVISSTDTAHISLIIQIFCRPMRQKPNMAALGRAIKLICANFMPQIHAA